MLKFAVDKTGSGRRRIEKKGGGGLGLASMVSDGFADQSFLDDR